MVYDNDKNTLSEHAIRGQRRGYSPWPLLLVPLLIATLSGCAGTPRDRAEARNASDVETNMLHNVPMALHEESPLDVAVAPSATTDSSSPEAVALVWERLKKGYQLSHIDHPRIVREINRLKKTPAAVHALAARSRPYIHHILDVIDAAGLPTELALLPAIESGFRPNAYSPDGAAGLWQFMPATGRMMGLKQDWWFDKRRTVRASTEAAIAYLQRLNRRFSGDWLHTLAAYNAGSAKVGRAIHTAKKRRESIAFWNLDLPGETDRYVPRLLALARVVGDPGRYGIRLPDVADEPYFTIASTAGQVDLAVAADIAGMPVEQLLGLNAGHRRWATRPDGPHELLLPIEKAEHFETAITALPSARRLRWRRHVIRRGDSLNKIARDYGVTVNSIRQTNGLTDDRIRAGKELLIPLSDSLTFAQAKGEIDGHQRLRYRVRKGDSLYTIARRFGVRIKDLKRWNRVGRYIRPGERLVVFIDPDA